MSNRSTSDSESACLQPVNRRAQLPDAFVLTQAIHDAGERAFLSNRVAEANGGYLLEAAATAEPATLVSAPPRPGIPPVLKCQTRCEGTPLIV